MNDDIYNYANEDTKKNDNIINTKKKKKYINKKLLQSMAIIKSKLKSSILGSVKSYIMSLYYYHSTLNKFDINNILSPTYFFNKEISSENKDEVNNIINTFLYMTYRTGLINMKTIKSGNYTSDCGWGCMVRCSQMILSKAFIEKKIFDLKQKNINVDDIMIKKIREEVLALFNDNYLKVEEIKNHPDYKYFWEVYEEFAKEDTTYEPVLKIVPPYSIHILSKIGDCAGVFTSDMNMIYVFTNINSDIFNDINIISFCVGIVNTDKLFSQFCEPCGYGSNNVNNSDIITYEGRNYIFKKGGLIFISFRWGTDLLDPKYYNIIPKIFATFRNNFGMIGGNRKRGYYFIGIQGKEQLIIADPHFAQETHHNSEEYFETYHAKDLYLFDVKEMRCQFSLCIGAYNAQQFKEFLEDAESFQTNYNNLVKLE